MGEPRQALVGKGRIRCCKLSIAVGRQIDRGEGLVVQRVREGQRDGGYRIISVIAYIHSARHNGTGELRYANLAR